MRAVRVGVVESRYRCRRQLRLKSQFFWRQPRTPQRSQSDRVVGLQNRVVFADELLSSDLPQFRRKHFEHESSRHKAPKAKVTFAQVAQQRVPNIR